MIESEGGGLVWVDRSDITTLADTQPVSYVLNLKLADPEAGMAVLDPPRRIDPKDKDPKFRGWHIRTGELIAETNGKL